MNVFSVFIKYKIKIFDKNPIVIDDVCLVPLTQGLVAVCDAEDYHLIKGYTWFTKKARNNIYANGRICGYRHCYYMHRLLIDAKKGEMVDHKDRDGLNNTKFNLRIATRSQNAMNRKANKGSNSEYKGIYFHKNRKKWLARIWINGKCVHLGYFYEEIDAARAYDKAATKHHGEFKLLNFNN